MLRIARFATLALPAFLTATPAPAQIPAGSGKQTVRLGDTRLDVFTYRPKCAAPSLLVVLHGLSRNARTYRNHARPIADGLCMIVVAPLFDRERFPTWRYQRGGIVKDGTVRPTRRWTATYVTRLIDWARRQEGAKLDDYLIGHSGGAQLLSRIAAFGPTDARRLVIANPSTHVLPNLQIQAPYGLGGVYRDEAGRRALRRYLAAPITIYLGEEDTGDRDLAVDKNALAQGATRYERGMNVFKSARLVAAGYGWTFNWRLVELPGVGHSARRMFAAKQAREALRP